ncbi:MAG: UvrD-helicase domain-containing protein [Candidatus Levybacteria bacterium]|nr:UvrD-helicase domain-containing protein [Candidatus Levybacteria bacterium]
MQDILNTLNSEQRNAVTTTDGPLIVLAGAGSGKTRVLIHKVLYLMQEKNIKGENILMVTFTNKAASEMKERIKSAMASHLHNSNLPIVGTFHSLCARILRKYGKNVSLSHAFRIYDTEDQLDVIKQAFEILDYSPKDIKPKSALHTISDAKNQMIDPETYASIARGNFQKGVAAIYAVYQKLLQEQDAVDFDDLMLKTIELFKNNLDILSIYQNQFLYILVDEYQDTNPAQYLLTKFLSGKYRNICIVGDFSQSIYSFRGADYKNLERFKIDFPEAKELSLSQNYRSTQPILDAAFSVISHNTSHPVLSLWTNKKVGESIELFLADSEHNEAEFIIQKVLQKRASDTQFNLKDVAVLYRTNAQSRALEETFLHHSIPYVLVGGTRFYSRKEVKDAISFLSFLVNQKDKVAHKRIEKLGKKRLSLFTTYLENFLALKKIDDAPTIDILDEVLSYTNYLKMYDDTDPEDRSRLENIKELRSVAIEFPNIVDFLENIALVEQEYVPETKDKNAEKNAITLMTIHSAKGLEFKMVFLIGMEEGLFPHAQSILESESIEEERRLAYVGITRAKEKLYLTFAKRRLFFGQRVTNSVSRFIFELPQEVLDNNTEIIENGAPPFL